MGASMVDYGKNLVILLRGHKADNAIAVSSAYSQVSVGSKVVAHACSFSSCICSSSSLFQTLLIKLRDIKSVFTVLCVSVISINTCLCHVVCHFNIMYA